MKNFVLASTLALSVVCSTQSHAAITCLFKDSATRTTPNRHCDSSCDRHADRQPVESLAVNMGEEWVKKNAFYRNATVRCEGGNGCSYVNLGSTRVFNSGHSMSVNYKTWSIPVSIVIEAEVCVVN